MEIQARIIIFFCLNVEVVEPLSSDICEIIDPPDADKAA